MTAHSTYTSKNNLVVTGLNPTSHSVSGQNSRNYHTIAVSRQHSGSHLNCEFIGIPGNLKHLMHSGNLKHLIRINN